MPDSRSFAVATLLCVALAAPAPAPFAGDGRPSPADSDGLIDLEGAAIRPFRTGARATVFVFTRTDCPISNRYAPELRRLHAAFSTRGVDFWLVYPDPDEAPAEIGAHLAEYDLGIPAARDPEHRWVRETGARITPEAVLFDSGGNSVYRGRIDDRHVDFGRTRAAPTTHDLQDALEALLANRPIATPRTEAVGCFIPPLR